MIPERGCVFAVGLIIDFGFCISLYTFIRGQLVISIVFRSRKLIAAINLLSPDNDANVIGFFCCTKSLLLDHS